MIKNFPEGIWGKSKKFIKTFKRFSVGLYMIQKKQSFG